MAKSKAQQLYEIGMKAYDATPDPMEAIVAAVANMLAAATTTEPKKRKASGRTYEDKVRGQTLYESMREECPKVLAYEPVNTHTFGQLGKKLREANVTPADLERLIAWLHTDPFDWRDSRPTWGEFVRKAVDWIAQAKVVQAGKPTASELDRLRKEQEL